ncbi:CP2G1 protein, partial [Orthonyx spaldingii]|nr:CP2G1 protein [Orthonyx spaldingii]
QLYDTAESFLWWVPGPHRRIPRLLARMRRFWGVLGWFGNFLGYFWADLEKDDPGSEFTLENLELTTLNLFFAGTETVASTLRFGLLYLMRHPEVEGGTPDPIRGPPGD